MSGPATLSNKDTEPRRRSWLWLSLMSVVIVAVALVAVVLLRTNGASTADAGTDPVNFADVVINDLTQEEEFNGKLESVRASGSTLIPAAQVDLAFDTPGTVAELFVQVGQEVKAGDVLARVDATTLAAQDEIAVAQAQINVVNEIAQLEASVAVAEAAYSTALGQQTAAGTNVAVSTISVAQAERQLADAQAAYQQAWDPARDWELYAHGDALVYEREAATAALQNAQENLQIAQLNYEATVANSGSSSLANLRSQLSSAKQVLSTALSGLAEHTDEGIVTVGTAATQAQLNLQQAELDQETHLAGATLIAPIDGTVMSINGTLGAPAGTGPFITLADLSQPTLEIFLDETNLDKVTVGSKVEVVFSALPTEQFTGTVARIDPQLTQSGDLSTMRALVQLDSTEGQTLPAGLTAGVNVVGLSNRIVRVFLPLEEEGLLAVGDPVTVELPDFTEVPGTVVFVPQTPTASAYGPASFEVLVELDSDSSVGSDIDASTAATLAELPDETWVDVIFVSDAVTDVMAVPVSALVALLEGGYAVEVKTGLGQPQLVGVEVGFFGSNNMIAVTSDALQLGDQVVVP
jgi:multidrug efflux pump subunit AcrA (membrane-fusion protein)